MNEVSLWQPNVGIESIGWRETGDRTRLPGPGQTGGIYGGKVRQSLRGLYDQVTSQDVVLDMTSPHITDPGLLLPHKFEAALLDVVDKMEARAAAHPDDDHAALAHVREIKAARDVWRFNLVALNMA